MQLEQPPPDLAVPQPTPFDHLRPTLWRGSKAVHITLVSLGSLMLLPGVLVLYAMVVFHHVFGRGGGFGTAPPEARLAMVTAVGSTCFGILAWAALSLLFFKRNDARWQRMCWAICAVFGIIASPCILGWIVWLTTESVPAELSWVYLIFLSMFGVAIGCLVFGIRFSRAAGAALKHPPTDLDRAFFS